MDIQGFGRELDKLMFRRLALLVAASAVAGGLVVLFALWIF